MTTVVAGDELDRFERELEQAKSAGEKRRGFDAEMARAQAERQRRAEEAAQERAAIEREARDAFEEDKRAGMVMAIADRMKREEEGFAQTADVIPVDPRPKTHLELSKPQSDGPASVAPTVYEVSGTAMLMAEGRFGNAKLIRLKDDHPDSARVWDLAIGRVYSARPLEELLDASARTAGGGAVAMWERVDEREVDVHGTCIEESRLDLHAVSAG
jgi:hypothetical protein